MNQQCPDSSFPGNLGTVVCGGMMTMNWFVPYVEPMTPIYNGLVREIKAANVASVVVVGTDAVGPESDSIYGMYVRGSIAEVPDASSVVESSGHG